LLLAGAATSAADEHASRPGAPTVVATTAPWGGIQQRSGFAADDAEAWALGAIAPAAGALTIQGAALFVKALSERAIATMSDSALLPEQRTLVLRSLLVQGFDVDAIGRLVLGRHWRRATASQQAEYRRLFESFIVSVYTSRFSKYSGETFTITSALLGRPNIVIVKSLIHRPRPGMPPVAIDWLVSVSADGYRVIDVVVSGVSMAITQRSEFASIIRGSGGNIEGLLDALRERTT
jgi:phospholipid transport system substrate-binding protein